MIRKTIKINKKAIQKRRMMSYFIEAANQVIAEEGVEAITIRKVADIAGYNSATLYNYFQDLDHLIFFSSMKYLKNYTLSLQSSIKGYKDSLDRYLRVWKCFCVFSFNNPKIYQMLFFHKYSSSLKDALKEYYEIFPEELVKYQTQELLPMLLKQNIYDRNIALLEDCVLEGYLNTDDIDALNEMTLLIYQGMLTRILDKQVEYSVEEAVELTMKYIIQTFKSYAQKSIE